MLTIKNTLPLSSKNILTSSNIDKVQSHLRSTLRPHDILIGEYFSELQFIHNQGQIGDISVNALFYGIELELLAPETEEAYLFIITLSGSSLATQGDNNVAIKHGTIYVCNPTKKLKISLSHDNQQLVIRMPRINVENFLTSELNCSLNKPLEFITEPLKLNTDVPSLYNFIKSITTDLDQNPSAYNLAQTQKHVEHLLLSLLFVSIPHNYSDQYKSNKLNPAPYFIRRAEKYLLANIKENVNLQDIVQASGTSLRSLQNGFRNFRNTTPTAYLKDLRLEHTRAELLRAGQTKRTITDIAMTFGFMHLSKYSKYYKSRFGESPSETIRRGFLD